MAAEEEALALSTETEVAEKTNVQMAAAEEDVVADLSSPAKRNMNIEKKPSTEYIYCNEHEDKEIQLYCRDCETPVCYKCVSGSHDRHRFLELVDVLEEKRIVLCEMLNKNDRLTEENLSGLLEEINRGIKVHEVAENKVVEEISSRAEQLKETVDGIKFSRIEEAREIISNSKKPFTTMKQSLERTINTFSEHKELSEFISDAGAAEVVRMETDIRSIQGTMERPLKHTVFPTFSIANEACFKSDLDVFFGRLEVNVDEDSEDDKYSDYVDCLEYPLNDDVMTDNFQQKTADGTTYTTYDTGCPVHGIYITGKEKFVIRSSGKLYRASLENFTLVDTGIRNVKDACVLPEGDILYISNDKVIRRLTQEFKIFHWANLDPYSPGCITATDNGHVFVCINWLYNYSSEYAVAKFSASGLNVIGKAKYIKLDRSITKMIADSTNKIAHIIRYYGRGVITVLENQKHKASFESGIGVDCSHVFDPSDVCFYKKKIIVSDSANHVIYLLNENGGCEKVLFDSRYVENPTSVTVDDKDRLWVGCKDKLHIFQVKI